MERGYRFTFRTVMVGLLALAMMLVYAVPGRANLMGHSMAPHQHAVSDTHDHVAMADHDHRHEHEEAPCEDLGLLDDGACCSVAQCATMHGGLPAVSVVTFVPRAGIANRLPALATPEGIGTDPALRPPSLTI